MLKLRNIFSPQVETASSGQSESPLSSGKRVAQAKPGRTNLTSAPTNLRASGMRDMAPRAAKNAFAHLKQAARAFGSILSSPPESAHARENEDSDHIRSYGNFSANIGFTEQEEAAHARKEERLAQEEAQRMKQPHYRAQKIIDEYKSTLAPMPVMQYREPNEAERRKDEEYGDYHTERVIHHARPDRAQYAQDLKNYKQALAKLPPSEFVVDLQKLIDRRARVKSDWQNALAAIPEPKQCYRSPTEQELRWHEEAAEYSNGVAEPLHEVPDTESNEMSAAKYQRTKQKVDTEFSLQIGGIDAQIDLEMKFHANRQTTRRTDDAGARKIAPPELAVPQDQKARRREPRTGSDRVSSREAASTQPMPASSRRTRRVDFSAPDTRISAVDKKLEVAVSASKQGRASDISPAAQRMLDFVNHPQLGVDVLVDEKHFSDLMKYIAKDADAEIGEQAKKRWNMMKNFCITDKVDFSELIKSKPNEFVDFITMKSYDVRVAASLTRQISNLAENQSLPRRRAAPAA